jgi:molybdopterin-biosynthesis enzyme MoeA-like protein
MEGEPLSLFGAFIIGDELLVGKRQDKHMPFVIEALAKRGLRLSWAHYLGDEPERITTALKRSFNTSDLVFSFGGIGATPDDHTRQCAAAALNVQLRIHPDAEREIRARFGGEVTPQRLQMGEFPEGSAIIPNPVNRIPGFSVREHHFVPGFPQMAWPMVEWLLDTKYAKLFNRDRWEEASILVFEAGESQLIPAMQPALDGERRQPHSRRAWRARGSRTGGPGNGRAEASGARCRLSLQIKSPPSGGLFLLFSSASCRAWR